MSLQTLISNIFQNRKKKYFMDVSKLPSQGYFYPEGLEIYINKGNIDDQIIYHKGIESSNIFGFISTVKSILSKRVEFNQSDFDFESIRAIDIFFIFIEFIKHTIDKKVFFGNIEFCHENFVYFDFTQYSTIYDEVDRSFKFGDWAFSLPSIGIETSLSKFSYEISIKGLSDKYRDRNYNLVYFLGKRNSISYQQLIDLIDLFDDLPQDDQDEINKIVEYFSRIGVYFLIEIGKKSVRVNPSLLKNIWPIHNNDIYIDE